MKKAVPTIIALGAAAFLPVAARAQVLLDFSWTTFHGSPTMEIPDHNGIGISDTRSLLSDVREILHIDAWFQTDAGFNGDLYVALQHGSGMAVLLNRPGRDAASHFGYDDSGFNVTFRDDAANGDIHTYQNVTLPSEGSPLTGAWQPDGRTVDPSASLTSSPRTAFLTSFIGQSLEGNWTLIAADLSSGGTSRIVGWGITVTVVPEPSQTMIFTALGLWGTAFLARAKKRTLCEPKIRYLQNP